VSPEPWPCVVQARSGESAARLPLLHVGLPVGSVVAAHVAALQAFKRLVRCEADAIHLLPAAGDALSEAFAQANAALREHGLVRGWRNEPFTVFEPTSGQALGQIERAATRFWGLLTLGAHCNGFVRDAQGRIAWLWLGQRAANKSVDPNAWDNLIGAGVAAGQTPAQALVREAWEEAGLQPTQLQGLQPGRIIQMHRAIPEGLQFERLSTFDLELPEGLVPQNQDGEVQRFERLPVAQALAQAASGAMTVDAALVTLDFAERHGLRPPCATAAALWAGSAIPTTGGLRAR
jgi:8-oxo-dGTP pyrophosphatase MutT (NUDIX family)